LKEVISLDIFHHEDLDEVEVYSEPLEVRADETMPFGTELHPESSSPPERLGTTTRDSNASVATNGERRV